MFLLTYKSCNLCDLINHILELAGDRNTANDNNKKVQIRWVIFDAFTVYSAVGGVRCSQFGHHKEIKSEMAAVGTWAFSQSAVERMQCMILAGQNSTDVIESAIGEVENDVDTGRNIVGRGGFPNSMGIVECDAAIMEGVPGRFGAVAALRGVGQPCQVARRIMDKSPHSFLVGEGAAAFAQEQGFTIEPNDRMLSDHTVAAYQEFTEKGIHVSGHDTIGLIALDLRGNITVGAPFKSPGRVGDTPIPGCGLYADHMIGAAAASGDGDKIMCYCPSFHIVELMRQGFSPKEACCSVLADIRRKVGEDNCFEISLIALNMKGEVGATSSVEFPYTFWKQGMDSVEMHVLPC
uniref:Aspartylglucosaminidase n=1 Tax=Electrophorus electricus TaxID=8005 RepID=A0A4W4E248_ELEEL